MTAADIAARYCAVLAGWLSPAELARVHAGDAWPDDFCDGNMAMHEAFERLGVPIWDDAGQHMRDDALELWNKAYAVAQARGFRLS